MSASALYPSFDNTQPSNLLPPLASAPALDIPTTPIDWNARLERHKKDCIIKTIDQPRIMRPVGAALSLVSLYFAKLTYGVAIGFTATPLVVVSVFSIALVATLTLAAVGSYFLIRKKYPEDSPEIRNEKDKAIVAQIQSQNLTWRQVEKDYLSDLYYPLTDEELDTVFFAKETEATYEAFIDKHGADALDALLPHRKAAYRKQILERLVAKNLSYKDIAEKMMDELISLGLDAEQVWAAIEEKEVAKGYSQFAERNPDCFGFLSPAARVKVADSMRAEKLNSADHLTSYKTLVAHGKHLNVDVKGMFAALVDRDILKILALGTLQKIVHTYGDAILLFLDKKIPQTMMDKFTSEFNFNDDWELYEKLSKNGLVSAQNRLSERLAAFILGQKLGWTAVQGRFSLRMKALGVNQDALRKQVCSADVELGYTKFVERNGSDSFQILSDPDKATIRNSFIVEKEILTKPRGWIKLKESYSRRFQEIGIDPNDILRQILPHELTLTPVQFMDRNGPEAFAFLSESEREQLRASYIASTGILTSNRCGWKAALANSSSRFSQLGINEVQLRGQVVALEPTASYAVFLARNGVEGFNSLEDSRKVEVRNSFVAEMPARLKDLRSVDAFVAEGREIGVEQTQVMGAVAAWFKGHSRDKMSSISLVELINVYGDAVLNRAYLDSTDPVVVKMVDRYLGQMLDRFATELDFKGDWDFYNKLLEHELIWNGRDALVDQSVKYLNGLNTAAKSEISIVRATLANTNGAINNQWNNAVATIERDKAAAQADYDSSADRLSADIENSRRIHAQLEQEIRAKKVLAAAEAKKALDAQTRQTLLSKQCVEEDATFVSNINEIARAQRNIDTINEELRGMARINFEAAPARLAAAQAELRKLQSNETQCLAKRTAIDEMTLQLKTTNERIAVLVPQGQTLDSLIEQNQREITAANQVTGLSGVATAMLPGSERNVKLAALGKVQAELLKLKADSTRLPQALVVADREMVALSGSVIQNLAVRKELMEAQAETDRLAPIARRKSELQQEKDHAQKKIDKHNLIPAKVAGLRREIDDLNLQIRQAYAAQASLNLEIQRLEGSGSLSQHEQNIRTKTDEQARSKAEHTQKLENFRRARAAADAHKTAELDRANAATVERIRAITTNYATDKQNILMNYRSQLALMA